MSTGQIRGRVRWVRPKHLASFPPTSFSQAQRLVRRIGSQRFTREAPGVGCIGPGCMILVLFGIAGRLRAYLPLPRRWTAVAALAMISPALRANPSSYIRSRFALDFGNKDSSRSCRSFETCCCSCFAFSRMATCLRLNVRSTVSYGGAVMPAAGRLRQRKTVSAVGFRSQPS